MAEKEQKHTHYMNERRLKTDITTIWVSTSSGFLALTVLCCLLYLCIEKDNTKLGIYIASIITGILAIFILRKRLVRQIDQIHSP